jgi:hypothetical protein
MTEPDLPEERVRRGRPVGDDRLPDDPVWRKVIVAAHAAAVADGQDGYLDPVTGLFVMTAGYLRRQRRCCDTGCRHCPYRAATP